MRRRRREFGFDVLREPARRPAGSAGAPGQPERRASRSAGQPERRGSRGAGRQDQGGGDEGGRRARGGRRPGRTGGRRRQGVKAAAGPAGGRAAIRRRGGDAQAVAADRVAAADSRTSPRKTGRRCTELRTKMQAATRRRAREADGADDRDAAASRDGREAAAATVRLAAATARARRRRSGRGGDGQGRGGDQAGRRPGRLRRTGRLRRRRTRRRRRAATRCRCSAARAASPYTEEERKNAKLPLPPEQDSQVQALLRPGLLADVEIIVEKIPERAARAGAGGLREERQARRCSCSRRTASSSRARCNW